MHFTERVFLRKSAGRTDVISKHQSKEMRAAGLLAIVFMFLPQPATSDIVRRSTLPEPVWGKWAADKDECSNKSAILISAKKYADSQNNCDIRAISESVDRRGTLYSVRAQCSGPPVAQKNLIIQPKDASHILAGADFRNLKTLQKCDDRSSPDKETK